MRNILTLVLIFIVVFAVSLLAFFPYERIVRQELDKVIGSNNLPLIYNDVTSGPFSTTIHGLELIGTSQADLGDVYLRYSPLSALTKKVTADVSNGFGTALVTHKGQGVHLTASLDADRISRILGEEAAGMVDAVVDYDYAAKTGSFSISSGGLQVKTPMMTVKADSLTGSGSMAENVLTISEIKTEGTANMQVKGSLQLDFKNLPYSMLNLEGNGSMFGMEQSFSVKGRLSSPRFNLK